MGDVAVPGQQFVTGGGLRTHAPLADFLQLPAGVGRGGEQHSDGPVPELYGLVTGGLETVSPAQVAAEPPQQLAVARIDHRPGPGRRVDRMVDDDRQRSAGASDPGGLGEEALQAFEMLQRQDGVGAVHGLVAYAGQIG